MLNRRNIERTKTFIGARIEQPAPFGTMNCVVRNLTDEGALLEFHNTATVMNRFSLVIPRRDQRVSARIVWRTFEAAGVVFETVDAAGRTAGAPVSLAIEQKLLASETRRRQLESRLVCLNDGI